MRTIIDFCSGQRFAVGDMRCTLAFQSSYTLIILASHSEQPNLTTDVHVSEDYLDVINIVAREVYHRTYPRSISHDLVFLHCSYAVGTRYKDTLTKRILKCIIKVLRTPKYFLLRLLMHY